ncbi:MAG: M48 family metallopeptidase [Clostridiales bacterium]|jgi:predicted metal-dependent hydrolase|nr:M48 family metallopeptidase [Clostridiales bacterium]
MHYKIIRSNRKTLAVYITKNAEVEVRAPLRLPEAKIAAFVRSKESWILSHRAKAAERLEQRAAQKNTRADKLPYLGKDYAVARVPDGRTLAFDTEKFILPDLPFGELKSSVINLYKKLAQPVVEERVRHFAAQMRVVPSAVKINGATKRWGSCSGKNSLNFSWMLAAAEPRLIDYVVVHELAHITEHNHSARFWAIVAQTLPEYKIAEKKLKELHQRLMLLFSYEFH